MLAGPFSPNGLLTGLEGLPGWARVQYLGVLDRPSVANLLCHVRLGLLLLQPEPNFVNARPVKLFEYMAAGIPVIASDFPLWRQIIGEAGCGLLVDPQDPQAIARGNGIPAQPRPLRPRLWDAADGRRLANSTTGTAKNACCSRSTLTCWRPRFSVIDESENVPEAAANPQRQYQGQVPGCSAIFIASDIVAFTNRPGAAVEINSRSVEGRS